MPRESAVWAAIDYSGGNKRKERNDRKGAAGRTRWLDLRRNCVQRYSRRSSAPDLDSEARLERILRCVFGRSRLSVAARDPSSPSLSLEFRRAAGSIVCVHVDSELGNQRMFARALSRFINVSFSWLGMTGRREERRGDSVRDSAWERERVHFRRPTGDDAAVIFAAVYLERASIPRQASPSRGRAAPAGVGVGAGAGAGVGRVGTGVGVGGK
jgi:hypothetical protein